MYVLEVYTAKPDKVNDVVALIQKTIGLMKKYPEKFKGVKSYCGWQHYVGTWGGFYEAWEVESFADYEKHMAEMMTDSELKTIPEEFFKLIVPGSHHFEICNEVGYYKP